jgi:antitoxin HigA-1
MFKNRMRPVHPGEVLREEYLVPLGMSANALAKALKVPTPRINDIVREKRGVTADTAMRLARYFGGDARSWLNLQTAYDLRVAEIESAKRIEREISPGSGVEGFQRGPNRFSLLQCAHNLYPFLEPESFRTSLQINLSLAEHDAGAAVALDDRR